MLDEMLDEELYEAEKRYWELMFICQELLIALSMGDSESIRSSYDKIREKVLDYRENGMDYMTAKKWHEIEKD